jgi:fibronectin type 3 domain-containing protein
MRNIFLLFTFHFLLLTFVIACGRRGEPVPIAPVKDVTTEQAVHEEAVKKGIVPKEEAVSMPHSPTRLRAVYTKAGVILTWDEIMDQDVRLYKVYRSSGNEFELVGRTITPAFTDRDVRTDRKYLYRVTAVTKAEGPPSQVIEIITSIR